MNQAVNMQLIKRTVLYFVLIIVNQCAATPTTTVEPPLYPNHNLFASDIFSVIFEGNPLENIVYSPASIQTCLTLTFIGAEGETAEEMRQVLRLGEGDKIYIAEKFRTLLNTDLKSMNDLSDGTPILKMANRLYVSDRLNVSEDFNKIALEYFDTQAHKVNFTDYKTVVQNVNQWVAQQTEGKIKDVLTDDAAVDTDSNAVLVNAIYFKANWLNPFSQSSTSKSKFYINLNHTKEAEFMYNEEYYGYAELKELKATVLEMPYNNSDISMLIILPDDIEGLRNLEFKLRNKDLNEIVKQMQLKKVHAYVPKFRIDFDIDLKEPLAKLGLVTTFTSSANFKSLFTTPGLQSITDVKHKAFLDVNEAGSEAAAATFATLTTLSGIFDETIFRADHPFIFAIRSSAAVYFAGHVVTI